jgi:phosphatidylethanolamine/phosphatidyl-N-methylethanolamine N-methyltransferase
MIEFVHSPDRKPSNRAALDADAVKQAYRRWARLYDQAFGAVSAAARRRGIETVNALPGHHVLEVGVGTGLALPQYRSEKRITGIDLSADMLARARRRVTELGLTNIQALREMDAEATDFPDNAFDIVVAMFVASVVPNPHRLMAEMKRVVRPGGHILVVGHYAAAGGPRWWVERAMAPASRKLGWHPDFQIAELFDPEDLRRVTVSRLPPMGIFSLVHLPN